MKLLRVGSPGSERPALLAQDGTLRDLSGHIDDVAGDALSEAGLAHLAGLPWKDLPAVDPQTRIGPCVTGMKNYVCIGANYADAVAAQGNKPTAEPVMFLKSLSAICGPDDDLLMPKGSKKTDWEVELAVVMGQVTRSVSEAEAMDYVAGYCISNDWSEREYQYEHGQTWDKGKGFDTFGTIGPWLVTKDEVADYNDLDLWLTIDGKPIQDGNTKTMIFKLPEIIAYVSKLITLYPGDIISTGTPPGGGVAQKPEPFFLKPSQRVRAGVEGLGEQNQLAVERDR